jgi:hypothetical protein
MWFRAWGWVYRPISAPGWLMLALSILFCAQAFVAIDRHSHSASDTLYGVFPYITCCFLLMNWLASKTAGDDR